MRVIQSNLHSCYGVIQRFREAIPRDLIISFADILFPEEKLSCIVGREVRFLLAVHEKSATGSCILVSSTEPLRTEILFLHSLRSGGEVLKVLLDHVLSLLRSRRAPDLQVKWVERMHPSSLRSILQENGFSETVRSRMILEFPRTNKAVESYDKKFKVRNANSLLEWRALYLSATIAQSFEEIKKQVYSETPYGTIEEDDMTRLLAYDGRLMVGTIGCSTCRNIAYLDKLSVLPSHTDRDGVAKALIVCAIQHASKERSDYVVVDTDKKSSFRGVLQKLGFKEVGQVNYFSKVITLQVGG